MDAKAKLVLLLFFASLFSSLESANEVYFFYGEGRSIIHRIILSMFQIVLDGYREADHKIAFGQLKSFTWRELKIATDDFAEKNVLGQGGFGKVYRGMLSDNSEVTIKRLTDNKSRASEDAFISEVELISVAVHKNLLRLIGFCTTPTERLLVYPYMKNLSAANYAELKPGEAELDWPTRKKVAMGTAHGLEYLHENCRPKIIHRDVKAANILLDENFEPVIGDFGLVKLMDVRKTSVTTQIRRTMGYVAPEYLSTRKASSKTDVFGYGIMLLELITGQLPLTIRSLRKKFCCAIGLRNFRGKNSTPSSTATSTKTTTLRKWKS